jgi:hypothetical protein
MKNLHWPKTTNFMPSQEFRQEVACTSGAV